MKRTILALTFIALVACKASAQTDTTHFDLGRTQLKKEFTQSITIKGADLEKQPFANLAEAINVWFYGTYINKSSIVYVIDGLVIKDVNAYSIHDIEEVTLVQNATAQLNGALPTTQQMVLIKTKRHLGKSGILAAGKLSIAKLKPQYNIDPYTNTFEKVSDESTTELYNNYTISAFKSLSKARFGLTADYLRDIVPSPGSETFKYTIPHHFDRLRLNGYLNANLGSSSVIDIALNYTPQTSRQRYESISSNYNSESHNTEKLFNTSLNLSSKLTTGLYNTIHAGYSTVNANIRYDVNQSIDSNPIFYNQSYKSGAHIFNIYDQLSYTEQLGSLTIESSLNLNYLHYKDTLAFTNINNGDAATGDNTYKRTSWLLTPSISLSYHNLINLQGGMVYNLSSAKQLFAREGDEIKRIYPFVNFTVDLAHIVDENSKTSLKVYTSYALSNNFGDVYTRLSDVSPNFENVSYTPIGYIYNLSGYSFSNFKTLSGGVTIDPFSKKLFVNYFFEKRNYPTAMLVNDPYYNSHLELYSAQAIMHTVSVMGLINQYNNLTWHAGLNATTIHQKI